MKIKGSAKNLKISSALVVAGIGTLAAVALRIVQVFGGLIDFETGFYTAENFTIPALYGILVIGAVLTIIFALATNLIMYFRLKKIDMIESLKSVE